jgi:hypothetical protein
VPADRAVPDVPGHDLPAPADVPGHDLPADVSGPDIPGHDGVVGHDLPPDVPEPEVIPAGECHGVPEAGWLAPKKFTQNAKPVIETSYLQPYPAVTADGRLHVMYVYGLGSVDIGGLFHQEEVEGGYTAPLKIGEHSAIALDLLVSPVDGAVHALYSNMFGNKIEPLHRVFQNGAWSQPMTVPPDPAINEIPTGVDFCIDGLGVLHMVYSVAGYTPLGYGSWSAGAGWTAAAPAGLDFSPYVGLGTVAVGCGVDGTLAVLVNGNMGEGLLIVRHADGTWTGPVPTFTFDGLGSSYDSSMSTAVNPDDPLTPRAMAAWYDQKKLLGWDGAAVQEISVSDTFTMMALTHSTGAGTILAAHFAKNSPGDDPLYVTKFDGTFAQPQLVTATASVHSTRYAAASSFDGSVTHVVWVQRDTPTDVMGTVSNLCDIRTE